MLENQGTKVDKVLNFDIADGVLEERITGRWIHPSSGRSYHTKFAPPKVPGKDDASVFHFIPCKIPLFEAFIFTMKVTGEPLIQRKDDNVDTLRSRLGAFHKQTAPVNFNMAFCFHVPC